MQLSEAHKEFVVKGYAQFMSHKRIVMEFAEEFTEDLAELCDGPSAADIRKYVHNRPIIKMNPALDSERYPDYPMLKATQEAYEEAKERLGPRFRRLNIDHPQFPEKYRALFNETRKQFINANHSGDLSNPENVITELATLYAALKQRIFRDGNIFNHGAFSSSDRLKEVNLAHQILKTIVAVNATSAHREPRDVTPEPLPAPAKPIADTTQEDEDA